MLTTKRLFLMPATIKMLEAAVNEDWDKLSDLLGGVYFAENWFHFPESFEYVLRRLQEHPNETEWWTYIVIQGQDARVAGTCGFVGQPDAEGMVEIGYEIADRYQNQGLAKEVVGALLQFAFKHPEVNVVIAHTLPEENASVSVLRHHGFEFAGLIEHEREGAVWLWRKPRELFI